MGCRPSKQATSKVRAVEYNKSDPACLCSPRKARKNHKCSCNSSVSSRRVSSGSKSSSKKHNQSSGHKQRSVKSTDVDFPAFSTTTAVYRTSASKTSKITLRLSCDGSTLEIEQCDYDLEKVRAHTESKPRPWNSAPNLNRLRDSRSRLFRDSYFPIKHSASGWSPSVTSTVSGSRGATIRVPVQINSPDEFLDEAATHSSCHYFPLSSKGDTNIYRDRGSRRHVFESISFSGTTFGKSAPNRTQSSGKFSSADERRPLLLDLLKESRRLTSMDGNINKAVSPVALEAACKNKLHADNSLDNMINELECSLELANQTNHSSDPGNRRSHSVEFSQIVVNGDDLDETKSLCSSSYIPQTSICDSCTPSLAEDIEQIPVNIISSLFTCGDREETGVVQDVSYCPVGTTPEIYFMSNRSAHSLTTRSVGKPQPFVLPENDQLKTMRCKNHIVESSQCITNNHYICLRDLNTDQDETNGPSRVWYRQCSPDTEYPKLHETSDKSSQANYLCWPLSVQVDSDTKGVYSDKQDFLLCSGIPSFISATEELVPHDLSTLKYGSPCSPEDACTRKLDCSHLQSMIRNKTYMTNTERCVSGKVDETDQSLNNQNNSVGEKTVCDITIKTNYSLLDNELGAAANATSTKENSHSCVLLEVMDGQLDQYKSKCSNMLAVGKNLINNEFSLQGNKDCRDLSHVMPQMNKNDQIQGKRSDIDCRNDEYTLNESKQLQVDKNHWKEIVSLTQKVNNDVLPARNISPPSNFYQEIIRSTHEPVLIDHNSWMIQHALDKAESCETGDTPSACNEVSEMEGSMELKIWDEFDKHEVDRFSEDAGYLMGLLCPGFDSRVSIAHTSSGSSFGFEYPYNEGETTSPSTSDTSDNEDSPLCCALISDIGHGDNSASYLAEDLIFSNLDPQSRLTYMQEIANINTFRGTNSPGTPKKKNCIYSVQCSDCRVLPKREIQCDNLGTVNSMQSCDHVFLAENGLIIKNNVTYIRPDPNMCQTNAPDNNRIHGLRNSNNIICDGNLSNDLVNKINRSAPQEACERDSTGNRENLARFIAESVVNKDFNTFSDFGSSPANSHTTPRDSSTVLTCIEDQASMKNVHVLIETRTSNCGSPSKNSGMLYTEQLIDTLDKTPVDTDDILPIVLHPQYYNSTRSGVFERLELGQALVSTQGIHEVNVLKNKMETAFSCDDNHQFRIQNTDLHEPESGKDFQEVKTTISSAYTRQSSLTISSSQRNQPKTVNTCEFHSCQQPKNHVVNSTDVVRKSLLDQNKNSNICPSIKNQPDMGNKKSSCYEKCVTNSPNGGKLTCFQDTRKQSQDRMFQKNSSHCLADITVASSCDHSSTCELSDSISEPNISPTESVVTHCETIVSNVSEIASGSVSKTSVELYKTDNVTDFSIKTQKRSQGIDNIRSEGLPETTSPGTIVASCPELRDFTGSVTATDENPTYLDNRCSAKTSYIHNQNKNSAGPMHSAVSEHFPPNFSNDQHTYPTHYGRRGHIEDTRSMSRSNVLSLVRYFEKVPYDRPLSK